VTAPQDKLLGGDAGGITLTPTLSEQARLPRRIDTDPERVERGLAQLVLTLIELVRQLMERQAVRRIDSGTLTDDEIERLGQTFMKLEQRMDELKADFGIDDEELDLRLGPLRDLLD